MSTEIEQAGPQTEMSDADALNVMQGLLAEESKEEEQEEQAARAPVEQAEAEHQQEADTDQDNTEVTEEAEQESETEAEKELRFEHLTQVAEAAGMDVDAFLETVKGTVKIDGEESQVSLKEALAGYQREADYTRKTQEVAQKRQEVETQQQQMQQMQMAVQAAMQDDPYAAAEQQLAQEYQGTNWQELKEYGDGTFADKQADFQQRHAAIQQARQQRQQRIGQVAAQIGQQQQAQFQQQVQQGREVLRTQLNRDLTTEDQAGVAQVLAKYGYTSQELGQLADPRMVLLAMDVLKQTGTPEAQQTARGKQVIRKTPVLRPGSPAGKAEQAASRHKTLLKRANKAQTDEAWADVLANIGV